MCVGGGGVNRALGYTPPPKTAQLTRDPKPTKEIPWSQWKGRGGGGGLGGLAGAKRLKWGRGPREGLDRGWRGRGHLLKVKLGLNLFVILTLTLRVGGRRVCTYPGENNTFQHSSNM